MEDFLMRNINKQMKLNIKNIERAVVHGRIRQGLAAWPLQSYLTDEQIVALAAKLGCVGVELFPLEKSKLLKDAGLINTMALVTYGKKTAPFEIGFGNRAHWPRVMAATKKAIDVCAENEFPNVIAFSGYGAPDKATAKNCVEGLKRIGDYAARNEVTICFEHLNCCDFGHPMKGHPGYAGYNVNWMYEIVDKVHNPWVGLLFDLYHVQIMHGEVMKYLKQCLPRITHVHVAGVPGRSVLNHRDNVIDFREAMQFLVDHDYEDYVGQEYVLDSSKGLVEGLRASLQICDV
jgi:hydroxypyruvate isomerase